MMSGGDNRIAARTLEEAVQHTPVIDAGHTVAGWATAARSRATRSRLDRIDHAGAASRDIVVVLATIRRPVPGDREAKKSRRLARE
jgi:hypothetical protein